MNLNEHQLQYARMAWNIALQMRHPDPAGFVAKIYRESSFNPLAYNRSSGAAGIAQFMPKMAAAYGVDVFDPESSLRGSVRYDLDHYKPEKGEMTLPWMYAAYNAGGPKASRYLTEAPETVEYVKSINNNRGWFHNHFAGQDQQAYLEPMNLPQAVGAVSEPQMGMTGVGEVASGEGATGITPEAAFGEVSTNNPFNPEGENPLGTDSGLLDTLNIFGYGKKQSELTGTEWLARGALYALGTYLEREKEKDEEGDNRNMGRNRKIAGMAPGVRSVDPFLASQNYRPVRSILGGQYRLV